jgi:glycosyltransferase involved in cell wall biosynthesis
MKIAFNARFLSDPHIRGFNRYSLNILVQLSNRPDVELLIYSDRAVFPDHLSQLRAYKYVQSPPMRYIAWEQDWLPTQLGKDSAEVFHSPANSGIPARAPCATVLTIHDAIGAAFNRGCESFSTFKLGAMWSKLLQDSAIDSADLIITVSRHARNDLVKYLAIPEEKIRVVYEAADPRLSRIKGRQDTFINRERPYFLYVGGWEERKNIPFLIRSFARAHTDGIDLLLAGGTDSERAQIRTLCASLNISDRVQLAGWVSDAELANLYRYAHCFVYPSLYEGFGLQLCEAMAAGCPIIASCAASLPEILGAGGELFDPTNIDSLAILLSRLAQDTSFRMDLATRSRHSARRFSWALSATETIAVYREAAALYAVGSSARMSVRSSVHMMRALGLQLIAKTMTIGSTD